MQKTIFRRYLSITMTIIVLSFLMLGTIVMAFFSKYWQDEKKHTLQQNVSMVTELMRRMTVKKDGIPQMVIDTEILPILLNSYSKNIEADVFITDMQGNILAGCFQNGEYQAGAKIPASVLDAVGGDEYQATSTLDGFYPRKYFVAAKTLTLRTDPDGGPIGLVFAASSASNMNTFMIETMKTFLLAAILVLAVAFFVVGVFAYSLVRPLRQMSAVVKRFGEGDFTARMAVETQDEMGQLAHAFNDMANSISNGEGMRRSFVANVSHELKTPMTTIAGFIDGILDGTISEEQRDQYLRIVSDEVKRLSRLVKSMLDLSRIDSGEMNIHPGQFDMLNTILATLFTFEQTIEQKKIEIQGLDAIGHQMVYGDQDLLHQVMYNLVENAVKFTNEGGFIRFQVTDSIDRVNVAIENSGPGIEADDLPMIFERFYKTDKSRSQDRKGMGLGLYIVRTIIKLHGGEITVASCSEPGAQGRTRFEFYILKRKAEEQTKGKKSVLSGEEVQVFDAEIIEERVQKQEKVPSKRAEEGTMEGPEENTEEQRDV